MNRARLGFRISKIDPPSPSYGAASIADALRAGALVLLILMAIAFFAGCASREEVGSDGVIRKQEGDHEIHGEAGAYYGRSG